MKLILALISCIFAVIVFALIFFGTIFIVLYFGMYSLWGLLLILFFCVVFEEYKKL